MPLKQSTPKTAENLEALTGNLLALMTGYVQTPNSYQRNLISHRVCMLMQQMQAHPDASQAFRETLSEMNFHWDFIDDLNCKINTLGRAAKDFLPSNRGVFSC